jgi:protein SCO1/2
VKKLLSAALAALAVAGPAAAQAPGEPANFKPPLLREVGFDQNLGDKVPLDITLKDEQGRDVRLGDYFGKKPVVLALVYYECPMLCTLTLNGLSTALGVLAYDVGQQFDVITVSFDPKEGPELAATKKQAYLAKYKRAGAEKGWHFLTGDEEQIRRLTQSVGFRYTFDERTRQFAHPSGLVVITPQGVIARYLYGIEYAPKDLRFALIEASEGKVGTLADQMILFCYQYDPDTGRYGAAVLTLVRIGGILTVAAFATFVFVALRREKTASALREGNV